MASLLDMLYGMLLLSTFWQEVNFPLFLTCLSSIRHWHTQLSVCSICCSLSVQYQPLTGKICLNFKGICNLCAVCSILVTMTHFHMLLII